MPINIKKKLKVLTLIERTKNSYFKLLNRVIKDLVLDSISIGKSPVDKGGVGGKLRYDAYSESYKSAMGKGELKGKKQRPVNLTVTGKMLRSIKSKKAKDYVRVWFTSPIAKYHNKLGAGKKKVIRRMVPDPSKGETFNVGIKKTLARLLQQAIKLSK